MTLSRDAIARAALDLLADSGLDGLTMRVVAGELGVRAPTLYWHVKNKAALVTELAEAILEPVELRPREPEEPWPDWLADVVRFVAERRRAGSGGASR